MLKRFPKTENPLFRNRLQAALLLADKLKKFKGRKNLVVLGIPRGGVPVAAAVAKALSTSAIEVPLGVVVTKKIPAPAQSELAIGVVDSQKNYFLNSQLVEELDISRNYINQKVKEVAAKTKIYEKKFRRDGPKLTGKTVIIADDGAATGYTAIGAVRSVKAQKPQKVILALPVIASDTRFLLEREADELVFLQAPEYFYAVGQFYEEFEQISDDLVVKILAGFPSL